MTCYIALLRGINVGSSRRVAMPRLRELLEAAGLTDVTTYIASGNIILSSQRPAADVASTISHVIRGEWAFDVPVVMRTSEQLQDVLDADPFGGIATEPKNYSVTFFAAPVPADVFDAIDPDAYEPERFALRGSELYTWTPGGLGRSPLMQELAKAQIEASGTNRNWRTITRLAKLATANAPT